MSEIIREVTARQHSADTGQQLDWYHKASPKEYFLQG